MFKLMLWPMLSFLVGRVTRSIALLIWNLQQRDFTILTILTILTRKKKPNFSYLQSHLEFVMAHCGVFLLLCVVHGLIVWRSAGLDRPWDGCATPPHPENYTDGRGWGLPETIYVPHPAGLVSPDVFPLSGYFSELLIPWARSCLQP